MSHPHFHTLSELKCNNHISIENEKTYLTLGYATYPYTDAFQLHHWLDSSKAIDATFRHRALRHRIEVLSYVNKVFPNMVEAPFKEILTQHFEEDFGFVPTTQSWIAAMEVHRWMHGNQVLRRGLVANLLVHKFGGIDSDYDPLLDYYLDPSSFDIRENYIKYSSWGIFEAEYAFINNPSKVKHLYYISSTEKHVPLRTICESIVQAKYGLIPNISKWLDCINKETWMFAVAKPLSKTL